MKTTMYAGWFLATAVFAMTVGMISDAIFHTEAPETPGYEIVAAEAPAGGGAAAEEPVVEEIAPLLASADLGAGETVFKKCASCHTVEQGGANKVGPNLWGVIGGPFGHAEGFKYSAAINAKHDEGAVWDFQAMSEFLTKPKSYLPGTAMGFAGLNKIEDRANLIAWMNQQSSTPVPLP